VQLVTWFKLKSNLFYELLNGCWWRTGSHIGAKSVDKQTEEAITWWSVVEGVKAHAAVGMEGRVTSPSVRERLSHGQPSVSHALDSGVRVHQPWEFRASVSYLNGTGYPNSSFLLCNKVVVKVIRWSNS
jgi:hypothetical protein